jgi:serine/threonine protein kinase
MTKVFAPSGSGASSGATGTRRLAPSVPDTRGGHSPGGVVPAAPAAASREQRRDPVEHQPGAALQEALINHVRYKRGNKAKLAAMLPRVTAQLRFEKDIKPVLKQMATTWQMQAFVAGERSSSRKKYELKMALTEQLNKLTSSNDVRACALAYIENKYGKETGKLQFKAAEAGGVFASKGTILPADLIRSRGGKYFMVPEKFGAKARTALAAGEQVTLRTKSPVLYKNDDVQVQVALQVTAEGINYVAVKKSNTPEGAGREHVIVAALQDGPVSTLRETAAVGNDAAYLFMDLAVCSGSEVHRRIVNIDDSATRAIAKRTLAKKYIEAVDTLHRQDPPIWHLDIKPDNFLLTKEGKVTISDFGTSTTENKYGIHGDWQIARGTKYYRDPQYRVHGATAYAADQYSLGMTLMTLSGSAMPEYDENFEGYENTEGLGGFLLEEVAKKLMDKDPAKRPALQDLLNFPYFTTQGPIFTSDKDFFESVKP